MGFEPMISALRGQRPGPLDEQAVRQHFIKIAGLIGKNQPMAGIVPATYRLQGAFYRHKSLADYRIRTDDLLFTKQLLYQLS